LPPSSAHHDNIVSHQKNLINASDTGSKNLYRKLVQVVLYKKLACLLVNLLPVFSCTSFLHTITQTLFQDRNHPARDSNGAT